MFNYVLLSIVIKFNYMWRYLCYFSIQWNQILRGWDFSSLKIKETMKFFSIFEETEGKLSFFYLLEIYVIFVLSNFLIEIVWHFFYLLSGIDWFYGWLMVCAAWSFIMLRGDCLLNVISLYHELKKENSESLW